jgi:hypothetical protein
MLGRTIIKDGQRSLQLALIVPPLQRGLDTSDYSFLAFDRRLCGTINDSLGSICVTRERQTSASSGRSVLPSKAAARGQG